MSGIRIHQGLKSLYVNIVSVNSRYVDIVINSDLSIDMRTPVGMSWDMIERYVRLNGQRIFQEYEKKKIRNYQALPITLDLEDGRIIYRSGLRLPYLGKMDMLLRIKYIADMQASGEGENRIEMNHVRENDKAAENLGGFESNNANRIKRHSASAGSVRGTGIDRNRGNDIATKVYMEEKPGQEKALIIKTDNDSQEFLRYCVMKYYRQCAMLIVQEKVAEWAVKMNLQYNQVSVTGPRRKSPLHIMKRSSQNIEIKNQLTLWGSCNRERNLKFDWKLAMLPMEIIDYIIVHELTHLREMNHTKAFWSEMEKVMPEYKECRNWLIKHGKEYEIF